MRYGEQIFEIDVPLDALDWTAPDLIERIHGEFHRRHEELYTYASRDQEVVFVNARAAAVGAVSSAAQPAVDARSSSGPKANGLRENPGSAAGARHRCTTSPNWRPAPR